MFAHPLKVPDVATYDYVERTEVKSKVFLCNIIFGSFRIRVDCHM